MASESIPNRHIVRAYDEEMSHLTSRIMHMGGIAEQQVALSVQALVERDVELARRIVANDKQVDLLEEEIDQHVIKLLATRQPMAVDLRIIAMALKITNDLERTSDYASGIAKRAIRLSEQPQLKPFITIPLMAETCQEMLKEVLDAYAERDSEKAMEVWQRDKAVDDLYDQLFRELISYIIEDPRTTSVCIDLLFIAKNLERIGDHATNVAEKIHYMMHGAQINRARKSEQGDVKASILVVEDEVALQKLLAYNLEAAGFSIMQAYDGEEALTLVEERQPDLILLDWMLPQISGLELCRRLRRRPETAHVPIIIVTARTEEPDRLRGLETGADDFVTKPFSPAELIARIRAVLRRVRPAFAAQLLTFRDLRMDLAAHRVHRNAREIHLSPTEFRLLRHFLEHPGRVFSRAQLLDRVWSSELDIELRTVDATIRRLRRALNAAGEDDLLRTVRAEGYSLDLKFAGEAMSER